MMVYEIRIPSKYPKDENHLPEWKRVYKIHPIANIRRKPKFWDYWELGDYTTCRQGVAIAAYKKDNIYYNLITKQPITLNLKIATIKPLW